MNKRCITMLKYILNKGSVKLKFLANMLSVSYRTALNDLKVIDDFLYDNYYPALTRDRKSGVFLNCSEPDKQKLFDILKGLQPYQYVMSKEDRRNKILLRLLKEDKPITLESLSNSLLVSRTTVFKSISDVGEWLETRKLKLIRKPNYGIYIMGAETDKRKAVMEMLLIDVNFDNITKLIKDFSITLAEFNPEVAEMFEELFDAARLEYIKLLVSKLERDLNIKFTDLSFSTLIIFIGIMLKRIKNGKISRFTHENMGSISKLKEYVIVENMCKNLSTHFKTDIPKEEAVNLMQYILCTNMRNNSNILVENKDISPMHILCNNLILEVELAMGYKFKNYDNLFNGLLVHLSPAVNRIKYDMQLKDPLETDIKSNYSNLFQCVKGACSVITDYTGKSVNDAEIAYITLHFCAAIENQFHTKEYQTRIIVVCSSGIGTAKILESRLKSQFTNIDIVDTLSYHAYLNRNLVDVDLIVSTIVLENPSVPCIHVNPLLPEEDCEKIMNFIESSNGKLYNKRKTYLNLLGIIEKNCVVENAIKLRTEIQELLDYSDDEEKMSENPDSFEHNLHLPLKELLTKDTIGLKVKASNWKEAVRAGSKLLLDKNYILPNYANCLIKNCERLGPFGPYCVISPGIAMPHARPVDGVIKTCMSLVTLAVPVSFNHSKYDPVSIIIVFGSSDGKNHLKALEELTYILMSSNKVDTIQHTVDINKVLSVLSDT